MVQMRSALGGIPVSRAMITDFRAHASAEPLSLAVDHVLAGFQQDFPVLESGRLVGVLTRADMLKGLTQHGPHALVGNVMQRQFETAGPFEMLESAFARLQTCGCRSLPSDLSPLFVTCTEKAYAVPISPSDTLTTLSGPTSRN